MHTFHRRAFLRVVPKKGKVCSDELGPMVGGEATRVPAEVKAGSGVHLHQQRLVRLLPVFRKRHLEGHQVGGAAMDEHGKAGHSVAPGDVVVVGVEEPAPVPAAGAKEDQDEKEEDGGDALHDEGDQHQVELEPEDVLHGHAEQEADVDDLGGEADDEGDAGKELDEDEPPRHQPLPDQPVLVTPGHGAACEHPVELELGIAEVVEAEFPEPHVGERGLGVLPGGEPVRRSKSDQPEDAADKAGDAGVEELDGSPLRRPLLVLDRVLAVRAPRHPERLCQELWSQREIQAGRNYQVAKVVYKGGRDQ